MPQVALASSRRAGPRWRRLASDRWTLVCQQPALMHLPPYAPELNPVENVWEYLRANKLCNLVWDTYDAIVEAMPKGMEFFDQFLTPDVSVDRDPRMGIGHWLGRLVLVIPVLVIGINTSTVPRLIPVTSTRMTDLARGDEI